jgi:hypothetical protein
VSRLDEELVQLSQETAKNLKRLGFLGRWWKRWKFMYKLTSNR